jgi:hypothetical protein
MTGNGMHHAHGSIRLLYRLIGVVYLNATPKP